MMLAKTMRPNTPDKPLYTLQNFYQICCMIWEKQTKVASSILDFTNHLSSNQLIYNQITPQTDANFSTKVVFIIGQAVQQVKRSAKDYYYTAVDWTTLDVGLTLSQIQKRHFNCFLPA
jgi:hypothetical protein